MMGITIHYRGTLDDVAQVEEMEDRVVDLTFALGGKATIWRSYSDADPARVIRGLMVQMAAGQETLSMLVSPEGDLINLFQIEEAEKEMLAEPPWCFIKTQFGSVQGHVAIVSLLDALKDHFVSNLEVNDESEYFADRDTAILSSEMKHLSGAIGALADGLQTYGLSDEAAEDPDILAARIERVARLVHENIQATGTTPQAEQMNLENREPTSAKHQPTLADEVIAAERLDRENLLRSERIMRRIEEARVQGLSADKAFELALRDEGLTPPDVDLPLAMEPSAEEPWSECLPEHELGETGFADLEKHSTLVAAESLLMEFIGTRSVRETNNFADAAIRGLMDLVGGLVQATSGPTIEGYERAQAIVQLKRALRGHALARGAMFGLFECQAIGKKESERMHDELESILKSIHQLLVDVWDESQR